MALENIHNIFENDVMTEMNRKLQAFNQLKLTKMDGGKKKNEKKKKLKIAFYRNCKTEITSTTIKHILSFTSQGKSPFSNHL